METNNRTLLSESIIVFISRTRSHPNRDASHKKPVWDVDDHVSPSTSELFTLFFFLSSGRNK